jgi:hypothetical protein
MPELGTEQWLDLFETWVAHYTGRLEAERDACRREIEAVRPRFTPTGPAWREDGRTRGQLLIPTFLADQAW